MLPPRSEYVNRNPIVFAQSVAFAGATGSITWQVLRVLLDRGLSLGPLAIALWITAGFAAGALLYTVAIAPLQSHLGARARLRGAPWSQSLFAVQVGVGTIWVLAWAFPGMQLIGMGGADAFYGTVCFLMGGLGSAIFYPRMGTSRTPV
jgi:hypothetical protein